MGEEKKKEKITNSDGHVLTEAELKRQAAFVKAWALLHEDDLRADWKLAMNGEETFRIDPLK